MPSDPVRPSQGETRPAAVPTNPAWPEWHQTRGAAHWPTPVTETLTGHHRAAPVSHDVPQTSSESQPPVGPPPPPVAEEYRPLLGTAAPGEATPSAVEKAARERGVTVDRARDYSLVPLVSYAMPPAPGLRLAGVSTGAAQDLRHRSRYVAVADSMGPAETPPATTVEYVTRVAELASHRAYHFPATGLQLTAYLAWLLRTYGHRPLNEARAADAKAREAMAASPRVYLTALDWELLCRPRELPPQSDSRRPRPVICQNFLAGRCPTTLCPWQRSHPACRICRLGDHPTELHGETGRDATPYTAGPTARDRRHLLPYPPRGRGYRR